MPPTSDLARTLLLGSLLSVGCNLTPPPEPNFRPSNTPTPAAQIAQPTPTPTPTPEPAPPPPPPPPPRQARDVTVRPAHPDPSTPDPMHGRFTLAQATAGLPPGRTLVATIETSKGDFSCEMLAAQAPNTVANFIGLARGLRDFWDPVGGSWVRRPYYDGSVFHRVIPNFMIQGGDILRSGMGGPGYEFADENVTGHNAAGLLCMANHGPGTNGGQFFITETAVDRLDGSYSIFGRCTPTDLVARIARVDVSGTTPIDPVEIRHVTVTRR